MADGSPAGPADGLTPEQQEVRRLLADARHPGPMPDDVADRLDRVLAGLGAGSDGDDLDDLPAPDDRDPAPVAPAAAVVPLASRRRRRRATTALVAAAAVVAVGIGLGQVVGNGLDSMGGSADSSSADRALESGGREAGSQARGPRPGRPGASTWVVDQTMAHPLRPGRFSSDVQRIRRQVATLDGDTLVTEEELRGSLSAARGCLPSAGRAGTVVPVRYRGEPGFLVFRPVRGDRQVVELFGCGGRRPLRSVTLPAQ
jgi:hypothetical protein